MLIPKFLKRLIDGTAEKIHITLCLRRKDALVNVLLGNYGNNTDVLRKACRPGTQLYTVISFQRSHFFKNAETESMTRVKRQLDIADTDYDPKNYLHVEFPTDLS